MLKKLFGFDPAKTTVKTEIIAGITTFLTMSYILAVNPSMFSDLSMPGGAVFTSTALAAVIGCLAMAFIGKLPFGLAPGMGLNAFFVYSVCLGMGYPWQFALLVSGTSNSFPVKAIKTNMWGRLAAPTLKGSFKTARRPKTIRKGRTGATGAEKYPGHFNSR